MNTFFEKYLFFIKHLLVLVTISLGCQQPHVDPAETSEVSAAPIGDLDTNIDKLLEHGFCRRCNLRGANLSGKTLINVDLRSADLREANLTGTVLREAQMSHANLNRAVLVDADLNDANLKWAELNDTDLTGANLNEAELLLATLPDDEKLLRNATFCGATTGPENMWRLGKRLDPCETTDSSED